MKGYQIAAFALAGFFTFVKPLALAAQNDTAYGHVYFMRLPKEGGQSVIQILTNYCNVYIDSTYICKLDEIKYFIIDVPAGIHHFGMQVRGKKIGRGYKEIPINIELNKSYFIQLVFRKYPSESDDPYCKQLSEYQANMILPSLQTDRSCAEQPK